MAGTPPATPPLSSSPANAAPHAGPAWTRNVSKPPSRVRSPYASNAASQSSLSLAAPSPPPPPPQATTNASQGGPSGGSGGGPLTTSTTAAPAHVQTEAPYLTHVQRHHGQLTLVAPDNLGARRQPGTIDPPQSRHDAGGGWGLAESNDAATDYMQPPWIDEELAAEARANKKLKSRKGNKKKDKEQKAKRERAIMSAVANAGKSPAGTSPLPSPAAGEERAQPNLPSPGQLAPSNGTTPRASPGLSSTASSTRPGMTPRTASGTSSSLHPPSSTAPSRGTRRTRATQGAAGPAGDGRTLGGSSSMTSGSSALGESPHRRPLEGPRPQPSPAGAPAANNPNTQESVRYVAHPNPAFVTTTAPTHSGPLQQSRAVARARAARNAHAAVQQAGIQARAIQAIQAQARAQREELAPPPLSAIPSPSASPASGASASAPSRNQPGAAQRRRNASPANTGTNHSADSDRASGNRQPQRPRMRHRPSEPPVAPETLAPPAQTTPRQGNSAAASARRARSPPRNAPPLSANQPGAASAPGTSDPNVILPPLNLSDPALLEDHLSLGLLDPAMLLMSPPPAYSGRRSLSSTRTIGTPRASYTGTAGESHTSPTSRGGYEAGAAYGLGMDRLRRADSGSTRGSARYSMPPAGSPPPSPSRQSRTGSPTPSASTAATATTMAPYPRARLSPPPPLTSSSSGVSGSESASNSGNVSSSASDEDEDDDDASSFEVTSTDPLVLAWEADRSAGIYSLDERIERDLERRRMAAADETEEVEAGDRSAGAEDSDRDQAERTLTGLTPTGTPTIHVPTDDATGSAAHPATSTTTEEAAADLAQLRRRISHAEASNNSRGVVRALSVHATRSLRAQGRAARERRGRPSELTANAAAPPERSGDEGHRAEPVDETIAEQREEETPPSIVGPAASQASASGVSGTRARSGMPLAPARSPSLSAVTTSSVGASPPRRRPLPVPPTSQNQHRIDAFTALRHSQGFPGYAASPVALEGPSAASPPPPSDAPSGAAGPPLPRRPPQREAPAPPQPTSPVSPPRAVSTADSVESTAPPAPVPAEEASPPSAEQGDADATATMADEPVIVTPPAPQPAPVPELSMYTDLDLLLARLESREDGGAEGGGDEAGSDGGERRGTAAGDSGQNYDDLLLLSDVLGQAVPAGATATELAETLAVARVECERRRVTKNGKVKSKLSVVGVRCVDCAICLARFKVDQFAVALPDCLHIFHEQCIRSWFRLSRVCPVCRHDVFPPRSTPADAQTAGETDAYGLAVAGTAAGGDQDLLA
ncbi:hypothetical protein JCM8202_006350 [Rhodotorula sphaerocarpa]